MKTSINEMSIKMRTIQLSSVLYFSDTPRPCMFLKNIPSNGKTHKSCHAYKKKQLIYIHTHKFNKM